MLNKKKIIFHSNDSDLWESRPSLVYKMKRGVLTAEEGDIVISAEPFDNYYLDYLRSLKILPDNVTFWSPSKLITRPYISFFHNQELKDFLNKCKATHYVDIFTPGEAERKLFSGLGLDVFCDFKTANFLTDKSNFRSLLEQLGIGVPRGDGFLKTPDDVVKSIEKLFNQNIDAVIIKKSDSSAGFGNIILEKSLFQSFTGNNKIKLVSTIFNYIGSNGRTFVVEELVAKETSPSLQYVCNPDGSSALICVHEQLFFEEVYPFKRLLFRGNSFPFISPNDTAFSRIKDEISKVQNVLTKKFNYRGYVGFDAVINKNGQGFIIDPNIRRIVASYPFSVVSKISKEKPSSYIYKSYYFPNDRLRSFRDAHFLIEEFYNEMRPASGGSVTILDFVPYNRGLSTFSLLFLSRDKEGASDIQNLFEFFFDKFFMGNPYAQR